MYFWLFHLYMTFAAKNSVIEKEEVCFCKYKTCENIVIEDTVANLPYFSVEVYNQKKFIEMVKEVAK